MPGPGVGPTHTEQNQAQSLPQESHSLVVDTDTLKHDYDKCDDRDIPWIFGDHSEKASTQAQSIERASRRDGFQAEETI